ncbi:DNA-binding response OmpR family regulator [Filimonas zeae]|uniref:DNA-binding response regulator n=1 Tax=Filimonas zeae TaxID=1737353 RepID=A0A917J3P9_9BACT|nr:response regulator transcription factor [Filimonas zeae]MDR6342344.1 DNA-binding response OmpR family regulator [Filimonas zeae]GGH80956.1 DNA-binding response regulator [Filimonas zeae]
MKTKVLFVEDETDLGNVVKQYLEVMDFDVDWCHNGKAALEKITDPQNHYHIFLIDISMPEMDGFELADQLIQMKNTTPFLFLTARSEKKDKLHGLKIGADDYITKPFDIDELVLRIKNIIRRNQVEAPATVAPDFIQLHDVKFHKDTLRLYIHSNEIVLTVREAELLEYLFNNRNRVLKREEILQQLWGENDYFLGRSLDVFISRLRKHLSKSEKIAINNVYGVGFVFSC